VTLIFSGVIVFIWMLKNAILSGWILYPIPSVSIPVDWKLPEVFFDFQNTATPKNEFVYDFFRNFSMWSLIAHGIYIILCFIMMVNFYLHKNKIYLKILILVFIQWIVVVSMGGNFRFLFPCVFILAILFISMLQNVKITIIDNLLSFIYSKIASKITLILVLPWLVWIFLTPFKFYTAHKVAYHEWVSFDSKYLISPASPSRFPNLDFEKLTLGNLQFNSPISNEAFPRFLYGTYQGAIPTVHKKQLIYFEKRFKVVPQLRSNQLSDGFKSIPSKNIQENSSPQ
jgi:hypothetical protein